MEIANRVGGLTGHTVEHHQSERHERQQVEGVGESDWPLVVCGRDLVSECLTVATKGELTGEGLVRESLHNDGDERSAEDEHVLPQDALRGHWPSVQLGVLQLVHRGRARSQVTDLLGECLVLEGLEVESRGLAPVLALECRAHSGGGFLSVGDWAVGGRFGRERGRSGLASRGDGTEDGVRRDRSHGREVGGCGKGSNRAEGPC